MSLDVYLMDTKKCPKCGHPVETEQVVFDQNITHNLTKMASEAGIYYPLWRPEEVNLYKAEDLIPFLKAGLYLLRSQPEHFKKFDAENGWGLYIHFVPWVESYLNACIEHPDAVIRVSR